MKKRFIESTATVARINVTPIIDVALVLVIILMVTAPMIAVSDVDVTLPPAQTRSLEGTSRITLTIGRDGEIAVDDDHVGHSALARVLATRLSDQRDAVLVVRADEGVPYASINGLIAEAKAAGAKRIAIATRQRGDRNE